MLWESIANSHWFAKSALILFLNKIDLFKEKLARSPITLNRDSDKEIYGYFTTATDTNLLKITMAAVQDMIIQKNLKNLIL